MRGTAAVLLAFSCLLAKPALAQQTANDATNTAAGQSPADVGQPAVFSKGAFIPFDGAQLRARGVVGVHLYYSVDRGGSWRPLGRTQPVSVGGFNVRPQGDGEYWFATRYVYSDSTARPEPQQLSPQQKVVFDTTAPEVHIEASADVGRIRASWKLTEANPAPGQLRLEYRGVEEETWHTVDLQADGVQLAADSGSATWPVTSSLIVEVRLQVQDQAGNVGHDALRLFIPRSAARTPLGGASDSSTPPNDPFSSRRRTPATSATGDDEALPPATSPHSAATPWPTSENDHLQRTQPQSDPNNWRPNDISQENSVGGNTAAAPITDNTAADNTAADNTAADNTAADNTATKGTAADNTITRDSTPANNTAADKTVVDNAIENNIGLTPLTELPKTAPREAPFDPPVASQYESSPEPANAPREFSPQAASSLPADGQAVLINRLAFPLAYDVESVGPSGVREVVPYVTRDGGNTWEAWGRDPDNRSPLDVVVAGEGVYGFRIVVINNDGQSNEPPQRGDDADVWVRIDATAPSARITAAPYGVGPEAGLLNIQWEASDENLAENPVTLSFAENPAGRWTTIAAGLPNDGSYHWRVEPHVPQQVYLRLEVRDKAGNVGVHQLREPINVNGLRPKAHIRGILPIDNTPRGALLPQLYR